MAVILRLKESKKLCTRCPRRVSTINSDQVKQLPISHAFTPVSHNGRMIRKVQPFVWGNSYSSEKPTILLEPL